MMEPRGGQSVGGGGGNIGGVQGGPYHAHSGMATATTAAEDGPQSRGTGLGEERGGAWT